MFESCTALKNVELPKISTTYDGLFYSCTSLQNVTLGSVGYPIDYLHNGTFRGVTQADVTITVYIASTSPVGAEWMLGQVRYGATNATIIIKSSIDGSTLVTSEVE